MKATYKVTTTVAAIETAIAAIARGMAMAPSTGKPAVHRPMPKGEPMTFKDGSYVADYYDRKSYSGD